MDSKWKIVKKQLLKKGNLKSELESLNTAVYRTKYKVNHVKDVSENKILDMNGYMGVKNGFFDKLKIISSPSDSASGSLVVLLKKGKKQFVLKITFVKKTRAVDFNFPDSERRLYSIMDIIVRKNISPHVFMLVDSYNKSIPYSMLTPRTQKQLNKYNPYDNYVYPLLTETSNDDSELFTINDLLSYLKNKNYPNQLALTDIEIQGILFNLMFQIFYTLHCFNLIGIKHNDLHLGNVFVIARKNNIMFKNNKKFTRRYEFRNSQGEKKIVNLLNIGLDVRIYDFDRSVKQKNNFRYYPDGLKSRYLRDYYAFGENAVDNPDHDTFKILCHLYEKLKYSTCDSVLNLIKSCFMDFDAVTKGYVYLVNPNTKRKNKILLDKPDRNGFRYYLLAKRLPPNVMASTCNILELIVGNLDLYKQIPTNLPNLETYSTLNIEITHKERVVKTIKARQLAKILAEQKMRLKSVKKQNLVPVDHSKTSAKKSNNNNIKKMNNNNLDIITPPSACYDNKTKRSSTKTSKIVNGKVRRGKLIDQEEKYCMFPFGNLKSQGRGKRKLMHKSMKCLKDNFGKWCATERHINCEPKKVGYCVNT